MSSKTHNSKYPEFEQIWQDYNFILKKFYCIYLPVLKLTDFVITVFSIMIHRRTKNQKAYWKNLDYIQDRGLKSLYTV